MNRAAVALIAAALLSACDSASVPIGTPPATPSPSASAMPVTPLASPDRVMEEPAAAASATAVAAAIEFNWSEVPFDGSIAALAADRSRFVAVGHGTDGVSAWTSRDGVTWDEHDVPERSFGEIGEGVELFGSMGRLIRLGDTLYSFGGLNFMDSARGAGWRWTDGGDWAVIESGSGFFDGRPTVASASDDALVVGNLTFEYLRGTYSTWRWTAATSWVKTALSSSADEDISVEAIAWTGGTFLAAGSSAPQIEDAYPWDWPRAPALWTSSDGRDWVAIEPPDDMSTACSVTPLPGEGFVIFGTAGDAPAAWVLVNRADWIEGTIQVPVGPDIRAGDTTVPPCSAAAVGDALLATAATERATLMWTSSNGLDWVFVERLEVSTTGSPPGFLAALGNQVLLVGSVSDSDADGRLRQVLLRATVGEP